MIQLLDRAPGTYENVRAQALQFQYTTCKPLKRSRNTTDTVVQRRRPVQRDDNVIHGCGDRFGLRIEEQSSSKKRDADPFVAKHPGQYLKTAIFLGLSSCKHHPTHPNVAYLTD